MWLIYNSKGCPKLFEAALAVTCSLNVKDMKPALLPDRKRNNLKFVLYRLTAYKLKILWAASSDVLYGKDSIE